VAIVLAVWPLGGVTSAANGNRTLIFVIDSSEAMAPYLSGVKGVVLTFSDQSRLGDYLGIVSFTNTAKLLTMKKILGPSERRSIGIMLDAITTSGDVADTKQGVARALEEVKTLVRKGDRNVKGIVVVSASSFSEGAPSRENLQEVLEDISKSVPAREWYLQYCYLDGQVDTDLHLFTEVNNGLSYDVTALQAEHGSETIEELYRIITAPERLCAIALAEVKGTVLMSTPESQEWLTAQGGTRVAESSLLRTSSDSRAVITLGERGRAGLDPDTHIALTRVRENPVTGRATVNVSLEAGAIWSLTNEKDEMTLQIRSGDTLAEMTGKAAVAARSQELGGFRAISPGESLSVNLSEAAGKSCALGRNRSVHVGPGQTLGDSEPAEVRYAEGWKYWSAVLAGRVALAAVDFVVPEVLLDARAIVLGPIRSGDVQQKMFPMQVMGITNASRLKMKVDISFTLPEGLALSTGFTEGDAPNSLVLLLKLDGSGGFRSARKDSYNGFLSIAPAPGSQVAFEEVRVPVTIVTRGPVLPRSIVFAGGALLLVGAAAAVAFFMLRTKEVARPRPHRVIGRLIAVNDPTGGRVGSINLEEISTKSSRLSLVVGRNRTAEVRLKHTSVSPDHCTLEAQLVGNRLVTTIQPIGSAKVLVNEQPVSGKTQLADGVKLSIGDFTFQFEDTQFYKKVDVVFKNGRNLSGMLDATGMDAESFRISPMDAVSPSERARIKFPEIRHVTFYRRTVDVLSGTPRPLPKSEKTKRVELMFKKGDTISGYVQREYAEGRFKYTELLPLDSKSDIDYIVVENSTVVEKRTL